MRHREFEVRSQWAGWRDGCVDSQAGSAVSPHAVRCWVIGRGPRQPCLSWLTGTDVARA